MNKVLIFALGATIGSLVTWKFVETKYKKIADEEIKSVIEQFKKREEEIESVVDNYVKSKEEATVNFTTKEIDGDIIDVLNGKGEKVGEGVIKKTYSELIEEAGYVDDCTVEADYEEGVKPYIITPEEFGDVPGYDYKSLIYYADGTLADDDDQLVVDQENLIGDALDHMGEYEDDAIHVRNEDIECDFEILRSEKAFSEIIKEDS